MNKNQEKHDRIKNLAYSAIVRGDITQCDRQPDDTYIITTRDLRPIAHTTNSAVMFLYFLKCSSQAEETETIE